MNKPWRRHRMSSSRWPIPVAISATHIHLTPAVVEELFCDSYRLHEHSRLAQPTQYAAEESVTLIGPRGRLPNVRIIGPPRSANQLEISQTDALTLGIVAPVRGSGDLDGTPGVLIEGPRTRVRLERGVIRALHHVHMSPTDAGKLGFKDGDRITVTTIDHARPLFLRDVLVRVSPDYRLELHLDPDEADAVGLHSGDHVIALPPHADPEHGN
jgi:propanediol utilization protein